MYEIGLLLLELIEKNDRRSEYDVGIFHEIWPMTTKRSMSHHWLVVVFYFIEDDVMVYLKMNTITAFSNTKKPQRAEIKRQSVTAHRVSGILLNKNCRCTK